MKAFRWRSLVTLIAAIGLVLSPWLPLSQPQDVANLGAMRSIPAFLAWHAGVVGGVLTFLAVLSLIMRRAWLAGLRLIIGIWLAISPWILDFGPGPTAITLPLAAGLAVAVVASFDLYRDVRHEGDVLSHMS